MNCPRCQAAELQNKSRNGQIFLVCPRCQLIKVDLRAHRGEALISLENQPKLSLGKLTRANQSFQRTQLETQVQADHRLASARHDFQRQAMNPPLQEREPSFEEFHLN
ncbi:hypothetical protein COW36_12230 [bacterium (Candidatus Blackallbacteria) CG17_big_fil_post_rev_8_21_14_2_50_48_46]|uniref:Uncharacterized protein n=1 Tax=bacterium (Candidatus Blackallbacteria) CG17_big_fil_post_rev_8_21_14_2_50_48_46 TaxID=2014261 RepID=A0A2M7G3X4_9BACT|nr:MAG: hypothetical protein COW64_03030 [bacterium (Candidatus Blackallbacteria) CG18_big_fil_WC_8_21_14_2_50_49_26]PIW16527.1 MAG: hypothetical protein COW36_12230 [bacterium (Candidatus Blackallbacteria) CG17_big_fil_post_rev_8_21_14_2_50_48_46]PIW46035.1 MAG: hypothetical protein COW20_17495 [bacterium (Candidatus Blackallbacteria) CG13_big_fil_rev_8_21_14_2_50_49_14]